MDLPPRRLSYYLAVTTAVMFLLVGFVRMQIGEVGDDGVPAWFRLLWPLWVVPGLVFLIHLPRAIRGR
jgi:hypothetical protein